MSWTMPKGIEVTMPTQSQRFVLLDRDGVINRRVMGGYVTSWGQFEFLPGALEGLRLLAEHGYAALVISNQACVGKKLLTVSDLEMITHRFMMEAALAGGNIAQVYYCVHLAEERCSCRKPEPGLIHRAQLDYGFTPRDTFFIGDSPGDIAAAANAGCESIFLRRQAFLERREADERSLPVASNLYEAAEIVLERQRKVTAWLQSPSQPDGRLRSLHSSHN
jgi:D-glycero-D-manno-heptose 1,7-bisphosphate phosphatase